MLESTFMGMNSLVLWIYDVLWQLLSYTAKLWARWNPRKSGQLDRSLFSSELLKTLAERRVAASFSVVFFCSSAGEYEQAKPLASRLVKEHNAVVVFVMGSVSGIRFAKAQGERETYLLAPWDRPSEWRKLYAAFKPKFTVIVRYELWPGFLKIASLSGQVYLIDAVQSVSLKRSRPSRWLWKWLLDRVTHIFVVGEEDREFYRSYLARAQGDLSLVGDTKYDRVLERIQERADKRDRIAFALAKFVQQKRVILLGSAWPDDLTALLSVFPQLKREAPELKLIVAPHDVSDEMAVRMLHALEGVGLSVHRSSHKGLDSLGADEDVLLVDEIGLLPELYGLADLAWVGGGMHHRVHNVLEPACWGLFLCFGPYFQTSQEARALVGKGLAKVLNNGDDFATWFRTLPVGQKPPNAALWQAVEAERGASDRILQKILHDLKLKES